MVFNSLTFVVFFFVLFLVHRNLPNFKMQKIVLLVASYIFYGAWNPPFLLLLVFSTMLDWKTGEMCFKSQSTSKKNFWLILSLIGNLSPLFYFKYGVFMMTNFQNILALFNISYVPPVDSIILPVGISFYTFQTMSYTLDIYRGKMKPTRSLLDFALYVTFFPQLVAGPIVRAIDFLPQLEKPKRASSKELYWGLYLLTLGLFQKVVLADVFMAPAADSVFSWNKGPLSFLDAWVGAFAFSGQIFFDFNGYSLCAIGISLTLGYHIMDNFMFPYASIGFSDFWRRWHISLSTFLRDYLYIPLGGNKGGNIFTFRNLMLTMLIGGLWHGASWTFVLWGGVHGFLLIFERIMKNLIPDNKFIKSSLGQYILWLLTIFALCFTWVIFRAKDFANVKLMSLVMLGIIPDGAKILSTIEIVKVMAVFMSLLCAHRYLRDISIEKFKQSLPSLFIIATWAFMLFMISIAQGGGNAFIYFQF